MSERASAGSLGARPDSVSLRSRKASMGFLDPDGS